MRPIDATERPAPLLKQGRLGTWLAVFFVLSGFCGLVYQVVWLRLAMAAFGVNTPVMSIVVSAFMGGLALGNWAGGHWARGRRLADSRRPLQLYAVAECAVALSSFVVAPAFDGARGALAATGFGGWGSAGYHAGVAVAVSLVLLPFCVAMGATFPLALWALRSDPAGDDGRGFSRLYGPNVLGAMLGCLTSAFVLVEALGLRGSLATAAALNAAIACGALLLSLQRRAASGSGSGEVGLGSASQAPPRGGAWTLVLLFVTGFSSMAMEIVWTRQYTPYLGNVVYAFALIVAVYLAATYLGTWLYRTRRLVAFDERTALAGAAAFGLLPIVLTDPRLFVPHGLGGAALRVGLGIGPFCAALGLLTPGLIDRFSAGDPRRAGRAYAVNTLGCIGGPLAASFVLLPSLPERWTIALLASLLSALALAPRARTGEAVGGSWPSRLAWSAVLLAGSAVLLGRDSASAGARIVRRDHTATVSATGEGRSKRLAVNGVAMTALTPMTKVMAHAPLAFHDTGATHALVVCFGMGTSFRSALRWGVDTTAVELVPSVPALFGFYHEDGPALLRQPNARVVVDDGRRFLEWTPNAYDVIVVDPPPPVQAAGSSLLYSTEFYAAAARRLRPGGILQQWIPGSADDFTALAFSRAFLQSFAHVRLFNSIEGWGLHLLGSDRPIPARDARALAARMPAAAARDLVEWYPAAPTAEETWAALLERERDASEVALATLAVPPLRDDRPYNEYFVLRRWRRR